MASPPPAESSSAARPTPRPTCAVFAEDRAQRARAGRTLRALRLAGLDALDLTAAPPVALAEVLAAGAVWLVRAGAYPVHLDPAPFPPPSDTGLPLCALGAVRAPLDGPRWASGEPSSDPGAAAWSALLRATGGDLDGVLRAGHAASLSSIASAFVDAPLALGIAARLAAGGGLAGALLAELGARRARVVWYAPLDVHDPPALRVAQVVTSLQQGGAERIAVELTRELARRGVHARLCALYRPLRATFDAPAGTLDLSAGPGPAAASAGLSTASFDREARIDALARELITWGADLAHAHLLDGEDISRLAARGFPPLITVHNARAGWPAGLDRLAAGEATLLVACARAVEVELAASGLPVPARTVWNGISLAPSPPPAEVDSWRRRLDLGASDLVLLALANPRPQKRLHLLPAILAAVQAALARAGGGRRARLVIAGSASPRSAPAAAAEAELRREIERHGVGADVRFAGSVADVASLLAEADVLVAPSAYEGLSLAHLEALAAGLPVVATGEGGTAELARDNPALAHLPLDAAPERFAEEITGFTRARPSGGRELVARHFSLARMAEGYARLYPRALARGAGARRGEGLLLVTNNFSTGGAQSSARRLLLGLAAAGVRARAVVIEEQPEHPTPGRRALVAAGIPVLALPPPRAIEPAQAIERLLGEIDADPPRAVLLWNVIPEHKVLLADALLDIPLLDTSPGEMFFASLHRYFASPRPGLPYRSPREYGARLAGVIVKYQGEAEAAAEALGAKVHVVRNGVCVEAGPPPPRPAGSRLVIGTAARIHPHKKLGDLLAALRHAAPRLPPYELRIAGGVEQGAEAHAAELRRLAEGLSVVWAGEVGDSRPFLRELDVFALIAEPAGCPNASLEAMAEGLPVVATAVGGMSEQVEDGVTGRLLPPGDAGAFAEALLELAGDPALRARMGAAGRERVRRGFSLERMVAEVRRVCALS